MLSFGLLLCLCLIQATVGDGTNTKDGCGTNDFKTFNTCFKTSIETALNINGSKEELHQQLTTCFIKNQCAPPDFSASSTNIAVQGVFPAFKDNSPEEIMKCVKQVVSKMSPEVESCVAKKFPGFTVMDITDLRGIDFNDNAGVTMMKTIGAVQCCDGRTNKAELLMCFRDVAMNSGINNKMKDFCTDAGKCIKGMPCDAQAVRSQLCTCTKAEVNSQSMVGFLNDFYTCLKQPNPPSKSERGVMMLVVNQMVAKLCTMNPCDESHGDKHFDIKQLFTGKCKTKSIS